MPTGRKLNLSTLPSPKRDASLADCLQFQERRGGQPAHARVLKPVRTCGLDQPGLEGQLGQRYASNIVEFDRKSPEFEAAPMV